MRTIQETTIQFTATIQLDGKTATGVHVPEEIVAALNGGNRPPVRVTIAGYTYQTTVARMRGAFMFPVSAAVRERTGVAAGDELDIEIELDQTPRVVALPAELTAALDGQPGAREAFDRLSNTNKKRHVLTVEGAKAPATRERRIAKIVAELKG